MSELDEKLAKRGAHHDTAIFPPETLAAVTRKPINTVRQYNQRVGIADKDFRPPSRRGLSSGYSFRSLATYGAATPLINAGVDVATAYRAAQEWTWHDCQEVRQPDATTNRIIRKGRSAIGLFENDRTLLVYRRGFAEVVPLSHFPIVCNGVVFPMGNELISPNLVLLDFVLKEVESVCLNYLDSTAS